MCEFECVRVCVSEWVKCVCVCVREREKERDRKRGYKYRAREIVKVRQRNMFLVCTTVGREKRKI